MILLDQISRFLRNGIHRRHGRRANLHRQHARIHDAQPPDPLHPEPFVHDVTQCASPQRVMVRRDVVADVRPGLGLVGEVEVGRRMEAARDLGLQGGGSEDAIGEVEAG